VNYGHQFIRNSRTIYLFKFYITDSLTHPWTRTSTKKKLNLQKRPSQFLRRRKCPSRNSTMSSRCTRINNSTKRGWSNSSTMDKKSTKRTQMRLPARSRKLDKTRRKQQTMQSCWQTVLHCSKWRKRRHGRRFKKQKGRPSK